MRRSFRSSFACSRQRGVASAPAPARISDPLMNSSVRAQGLWLDDYALFRALKDRYKGAYYLEWPVELVRRNPAALDRARRELANQIDLVRFAQFLLFRQGGTSRGARA